MGIDEFFEKLPRDGWRLLSHYGKQRIRREQCCPLEVAAKTGPNSVPEAAAILQAGSIQMAVMDAADEYKGHDPALRARLLAHCNLTEKGQP